MDVQKHNVQKHNVQKDNAYKLELQASKIDIYIFVGTRMLRFMQLLVLRRLAQRLLLLLGKPLMALSGISVSTVLIFLHFATSQDQF